MHTLIGILRVDRDTINETMHARLVSLFLSGLDEFASSFSSSLGVVMRSILHVTSYSLLGCPGTLVGTNQRGAVLVMRVR